MWSYLCYTHTQTPHPPLFQTYSTDKNYSLLGATEWKHLSICIVYIFKMRVYICITCLKIHFVSFLHQVFKCMKYVTVQQFALVYCFTVNKAWRCKAQQLTPNTKSNLQNSWLEYSSPFQLISFLLHSKAVPTSPHHMPFQTATPLLSNAAIQPFSLFGWVDTFVSKNVVCESLTLLKTECCNTSKRTLCLEIQGRHSGILWRQWFQSLLRH